MISLRPRSIFGVSVAGILLVAVPLLIVAAMAALYAQRIAVQSTRLLDGGIRVVQQCRVLEDALIAMERAARQYQVVPDAALLEQFGDRHADVTAVLADLSAAQQPSVRAEHLAQVREDADAVAVLLKSGEVDAARFENALERFEQMRERAADIRNEAREFIEGEARTIQSTALRSEHMLIAYGVLLAPVVILVAAMLAVWVALPLKRIDTSIREIGAGQLDSPVPVGGPLELQQLSRQLDWLRERLRSIEQDKNRFLRAMAHELKTPLASVREGADLLSDGALGRLLPPQQEVADILRNNAYELQLLIENLLAYEEWRGRAGRVELASTPLRALVETTIQRYRLRAETKDLGLEVVCDDRPVLVDPALLRMALDNLVSNAVKFSPPGGTVAVSARVEAGQDAPDGEQLVIEVADEGPGIPQDERTRIYEAFYQGAPPPGEHSQGTGIGLSVVHDFVIAHRGGVELIDGEFSGAHFRICLPMPPPPGEVHGLAA
jgi:two-component system sensor histidine kinase GlrK